MREVKMLCWNVNGIRAVAKKGFLEWLSSESPDILCLQETKAHPDQLSSELHQPAGYRTYWNHPEQTGYSGVATFTREVPLSIQYGFGRPEFDIEGRVIITRYPQFVLINVYFPNGTKDDTRLQYKMDFYDAFLEYADRRRARGEKLVICGDFNTAHKAIDLARPKENEKNSGFLPEEREWMDKFVSKGYVDTFRHFTREPKQYTWWDPKTRARERNVGWRLDYFFITANLLPSLSSAYIVPDVMGSDHCPIGITLRTD